MSEERDTDRAVVKTHVPAYQKRIWVDHADRLDMSQSEFVRTMVQAGRRGFEPTDDSTADSPNTSPAMAKAANTDLETRVETILTGSDPLSWDQLISELTDNLEDRLEETLETLQAENRVRYSGRNGGYTLNDRP